MDGCRFAYLTDSIQFKSDESNFVRGLFFFDGKPSLVGGGGGGGLNCLFRTFYVSVRICYL